MINKVEILSPGINCWKTKKIIESLNKFFRENDIQAEILIVTNQKDFLKYRTWLLPTIIINDKVVARGYRPSNNKILKTIK